MPSYFLLGTLELLNFWSCECNVSLLRHCRVVTKVNDVNFLELLNFMSLFDISFDIPTVSYPNVLCSICQRTRDWENSSRARFPALSYP